MPKTLLALFLLTPSLIWGLTFKSDGSIVDRDGNELQSASEILKDENNSSKSSQPNIKGLNLTISVPNVKPDQIFYKNGEEIGRKVNGINVVIEKEGFPVFAGKTSIQFKVTRFDAGCNKSGNYCDERYGRSRQEYFDRYKKLQNAEYIYEWAIFFPSDYESLIYGNVIYGQMHYDDEEKGCSNAVSWWFHDRKIVSENKSALHFSNKSDPSPAYPIIDLVDELNQWHFLKLHIKYAENKKGKIRLYKNNELVKKYDDVTTLTKGCSKGFFKFGIYRNGHERYWIDGNFDDLHTQTVYYDNVYVYKPKKDERFYEDGAAEKN